MIALIESNKAGLFKPQYWAGNIMSGIIVGFVSLPLSMAFAIAIGATPEQGLYTAIVAGIVVGLFGGTRMQVAGPTGAFIVLLSDIVHQHGMGGLQIATIMAGLILLFMGFTKMGHVIKFIPQSVVIGFTSGIGCIIFIGQWKDFFGLSNLSLQRLPLHLKVFELFMAWKTVHLTTFILSSVTLLIILIIPKIIKRVPAILVATFIMTLIQAIFQFQGVATIGNSYQQISNKIPNLSFPAISLEQILTLIGPAFSIAILGAIESLLSAVITDNLTGIKHNSNQELIGQGLANLICPLFSGFAATGAVARTVINVRNGGNSPLSAIVNSITLLLIIVMFSSLTNYIPLGVLAAILCMVAYNMSEPARFVSILKNSSWVDAFLLLITCILTIFVDLIVAVGVGVFLSMLINQLISMDLKKYFYKY